MLLLDILRPPPPQAGSVAGQLEIRAAVVSRAGPCMRPAELVAPGVAGGLLPFLCPLLSWHCLAFRATGLLVIPALSPLPKCSATLYLFV